ncbi:unnamed protein product [Phyllotreta striolata]|uniref:Dynein intermediate chain 3, ciliary n=1 Tax=Phyllotreta striolata TaxID=444603 RepID=A0A9P0DUN3_PHYSR|nr:unnamed protein product [Phyllotreta striolata]
MEISYQYQKKRSDFGRQPLFSDKGPDLVDHYPSNRKIHKEFILKDPVSRSTQLAPVYAEHYLNTMSTIFKNTVCNHAEGGWPKDVNCFDEEQTKRYRRKIEKEDNYHHICMQLFKNMESCVLQNNAINIYQEYFEDLPQCPMIEKNSARTVNVYQDQTSPVRPVNHISWSPDNQTKFVVSHCNLAFQAIILKQSANSYIWEVENPNRPLHTLKPEQQCVSIEYNMKDPSLLVSGQINGQVALWDVRKGVEPVDVSLRETSFLDPVQNVMWIHSKTNTEFFSSSTDGMVKWWDTRNLSEPTDTLILDYAKEPRLSNALGASCLEYEITIPTRFMVGTEEGVLVMGVRKGKTSMEKMTLRIQGAQFGPILNVQRNPAFLKNYLTVGDWGAKIWSEDCRESPIMWTPLQKVEITDGAWSATRVSTFFTTRADGTLDIWDFLQHQKQATLAVRICDEKLTSVKPHDSGKLVAVGNRIGTTYLIELSKNLSSSTRSEKMLFTGMLEREIRREKVLENRAREMRLKQKTDKSAQADEGEEGEAGGGEEKATEEEEFMDRIVQNFEKDFKKRLNEAIKRAKSKAGGSISGQSRESRVSKTSKAESVKKPKTEATEELEEEEVEGEEEAEEEEDEFDDV